MLQTMQVLVEVVMYVSQDGNQFMEGMLRISGVLPGARYKIAVSRPIGALEYLQQRLSAKL